MEFKKYSYYPKQLEENETVESERKEEEKESPFYLSLSNSWSRKTMNSVFSGSALLIDILTDKSKFTLPDENGKVITEQDLPDCIESIDLFLEEWISKQIILHLDFLLTHRLTKKES